MYSTSQYSFQHNFNTSNFSTKQQIKAVLNIIFIDIVLQGAYYNMLTVASRVYVRKTNIALMEYEHYFFNYYYFFQ